MLLKKANMTDLLLKNKNNTIFIPPNSVLSKIYIKQKNGSKIAFNKYLMENKDLLIYWISSHIFTSMLFPLGEGTFKMLNKKYGLNIIHNPEFLSEKTATEDFKNQKHIVLGGEELDKCINFFKRYFPDI